MQLSKTENYGRYKSKKADENTIRKMYGISIDKNSVHGSDSYRKRKKRNRFFFLKIKYY